MSLTAGRADCPHIHVSDNNDIISMFGVIALSVSNTYRLCCERSRSNRYLVMYISNAQICSTLIHVENIKDFHHYTNSSVETAAAAVNAGVNLEDANLPVNVFSHLGDAIQKVSEIGTSSFA